MEKFARSVEITFEKSETIVVHRRGRKIVTAWCDICGSDVSMLSPEEGALVAGMSPRDVYRLIESEQVHYVEQIHGELLVCIDSLKKEPDEND